MSKYAIFASFETTWCLNASRENEIDFVFLRDRASIAERHCCVFSDFRDVKIVDSQLQKCVFEWSTFAIAENASSSRIFDSKIAKISNACHIYWQVVNDRKEENEIWITVIVKICFLICVLFIYLCDIDENRVFIEIHWFDKFTFYKMIKFAIYRWFRISLD